MLSELSPANFIKNLDITKIFPSNVRDISQTTLTTLYFSRVRMPQKIRLLRLSKKLLWLSERKRLLLRWDGGADVEVGLREGNFDAILVEDAVDVLLDEGDVGHL